jgi:hypothetical protein
MTPYYRNLAKSFPEPHITRTKPSRRQFSTNPGLSPPFTVDPGPTVSGFAAAKAILGILVGMALAIFVFALFRGIHRYVMWGRWARGRNIDASGNNGERRRS